MAIINLRIREYVFIAIALATYALMEAHWTLSGAFCRKPTFNYFADAYYENDVILEFSTFEFDCAENAASANGCGKVVKNETRTIVNGKVLDGPIGEVKLIPMVVEERTTLKTPKLKANAQHYITNQAVAKIFEQEKRPNFRYFSCDEMDRLFSPDTLRRYFKVVDQKSKSTRDMKDGMVIYKGTIHHPVLGLISCFLKEAKPETNDGKAYQALQHEAEKRKLLGTDTRVTTRMLGECFKPDLARIAVESVEATPLCDDEDEVEHYSQTKCMNNERIREMIDAAEDKTRAAFVFIRELLCVFAEIEQKRFFVKDIHGKHISVTNDLKSHINNVDNIVYHGTRNILSGSICKYDENCPSPSGELWTNSSANRVVYSKCRDPDPVCSDTSCVGYNSTLHICGIARWLLQPLYDYFQRIQDRSRMTHIIMSSMNSWPFLRRSVVDSCEKATLYLSLYDTDMLAQQQPAHGGSFHVGPAHKDRKPVI